MQLTKFHSDLDELLSSHFALGRRRLFLALFEASEDASAFTFNSFQFFLERTDLPNRSAPNQIPWDSHGEGMGTKLTPYDPANRA